MKQGDSVLALQQYTTTSESPKILSKKRGAGHLKSSRGFSSPTVLGRLGTLCWGAAFHDTVHDGVVKASWDLDAV